MVPGRPHPLFCVQDTCWEVAAQRMLDWLTKVQAKEEKQHAAA